MPRKYPSTFSPINVNHFEISPGRIDFSFILERLKSPFVFKGNWSTRGNSERWTIIGSEPICNFSIEPSESPIDKVRSILAKFDVSPNYSFLPFVCGLVGYFSYELGRIFEPMAAVKKIDFQFPNAELALYDTVLLINENGQGFIAQTDITGDIQGMRSRLKALRDLMKHSVSPQNTNNSQKISRCESKLLDWSRIECNTSHKDYLAKVHKIKEYIAAGDVYQVNITRRLHTQSNAGDAKLFDSVVKFNPAPYSCFFRYEDYSIISGSPELFLSFNAKNRLIETRPIKGTIPRGVNEAEDSDLARQLLESEKDRAENVMIVDMLRNDLGRVAEYGSVYVTKLFDIEKHPSVFQMVSTVKAKVRNEKDVVDILSATFPGGSITGAPKVRAMQIIEELEPDPRGPYTGCAGFFDLRGDMILNILIRSIILKDGIAFFHAGGGIVADSDPEMEFKETEYKAAGLLKAIYESENENG